MNFELLVGLRYVRARRRIRSSGGGFLSFISFVSMAGIALGVAALIIVLSVMNGFQEEIRTRILSVVSHMQISNYQGEIGNWQTLAGVVQRNPDVLAVAPFVQQQGMFALDGQVRAVAVRGIDPRFESEVADFAQVMREGRLDDLAPGSFGVVLGADLARLLEVKTGDKVALIAPQAIAGTASILPRVQQLTVTGIFEAGFYELDAGLALIDIADAQQIYQMGDSVSGVRLKLRNLFDVRRVAMSIGQQLPHDYYVSDWSQSYSNLFMAVQQQKRMMFIILSLIVAVAAFNIVSALVMAVQRKRADIAILRTLGAAPRSIMTIFVAQGATMGLIGIGVGVALGLLVALNIDVIVPFLERLFDVHFLAKDVYHLSEMPSRVIWADVVTVAGVALLLTLCATLYPSWRAAKIEPAEALRYE